MKAMKMLENFKNRLQKKKKDDWIVLGFLGVVMVLAYYFSISFSVKMANGYTLFGDSNSFSNVMETKGPTSADIMVLILFWVLTVILSAIFVFLFFFKKPTEKKVVKKEIIDGKTVIVKDEKENENH